MDYDTFPVPDPKSQKNVYVKGANTPTTITRYPCACGWGRLLHYSVGGFDDDYYVLRCLRCRLKYQYVTRVGYDFEYYRR